MCLVVASHGWLVGSYAHDAKYPRSYSSALITLSDPQIIHLDKMRYAILSCQIQLHSTYMTSSPPVPTAQCVFGESIAVFVFENLSVVENGCIDVTSKSVISSSQSIKICLSLSYHSTYDGNHQIR